MSQEASERRTPARSRVKGSGSSSPSSRSLADVVEAVKASWAANAEMTPGTLRVYGDLVDRFAAYASASGARHPDEVGADVVTTFMDARHSGGAPPTTSTSVMRVQAVRALYREGRRLGLATIDPTMDVVLGRAPATSTRPLTDSEIELCRRYALDSSTSLRRPLAWAIAEAGGRALEIAATRIADVDLEAGSISFPGTEKYGARLVPLTEWGATQVSRRLGGRRPPEAEAPLIPWKTRSGAATRSSASMAITETLRATGLQEEAQVRPHSVGLWRGVHWLGEGRTIDEVAWLLGYRNLDTAAEALGFEWWNR